MAMWPSPRKDLWSAEVRCGAIAGTIDGIDKTFRDSWSRMKEGDSIERLRSVMTLSSSPIWCGHALRRRQLMHNLRTSMTPTNVKLGISV